MPKYILSINAGSSSLKLSLYSPTKSESHEPLTHLVTASFSSISSAPPAKFSVKPGELDIKPTKEEDVADVGDHAAAFARFLEFLQVECRIDKGDVMYLCHRVVHGGGYDKPIVIDQTSFHQIEALSDLAPLHNGAALSVVMICTEQLPEAVSVAYFDTIFHRSLPPQISSYCINPEVAKERGLRKYGFHGISYSYILRSVASYLQKAPDTLNLILLHLGSGASACAVRGGKSYDTSMGLTPVSGLPGATRSGAIDPSLIFHYTNKAGTITHDPSMAADLPVTLAEEILNKESGWKAMCGTTDFAKVVEKRDDPKYGLAFDIFVDRILNYVGGYFVKLGGEVDGLVFSGGIGEKSWELRKVIGERVQCLGFQAVDDRANQGEGHGVWDIGGGQSGKRVLVCETDEQYEMARQCVLGRGMEVTP